MINKEGFKFSFDESACASCNGKCCTGESGYIWLTPKEILHISSALKLDSEDFKTTYLVKEGYRFSIKEIKKDESFECIFFDSKNLGCSIYDVRPNQCRTFPFWDYFLKHPQKAGEECPSIVYHS